MKIKDLQIGIKLEIELYDENGKSLRPTLVSELELHENEDYLYIAAPMHEGTIFPVRRGTHIGIYFIDKGGLYKFKSTVLDREVRDNIPMLKVKSDSQIERIQRRQFFRIECLLPINYTVLTVQGSSKRSVEEHKKTVVRDISGGGLCMALEEKLEMGQLVDCELYLSENKKISFLGKVVRSNKCEVESKYKFDIGIEFAKINNKDREDIISFIFQEQRRLRLKGLI